MANINVMFVNIVFGSAVTNVTMLAMNKKDAIAMLGGTPGKAAKALGYKTVHAVYVWPDPLPLGLVDRVRGAAMRIKAAAKRTKVEV